MAFTDKPIDGNRVWDLIRPLDAQSTHHAVVIPQVTKGDYDLSRDTNDTDTKNGKLVTVSNVTVEPKVEVIDTDSRELMYLTDSFMKDKPLEHWHLFLDRKNDDGKYFAFYSQVRVTEDSQGSDSGDFATRKFTFTPKSGVTYGYTPLPDGITEEDLDSLEFIGTNPVTSSDPTGGGVAAGVTAMPTETVNGSPEGGH
ncbi:MAG: phage tail tube protein [Limosilactobacillus sp.]|nr:phage tail tube protein [Limosilactobacillus sp.]